MVMATSSIKIYVLNKKVSLIIEASLYTTVQLGLFYRVSAWKPSRNLKVFPVSSFPVCILYTKLYKSRST